MVEGAGKISKRALTAALLASQATCTLAAAWFDASWPVKTLGVLAVNYLVLTLFLHPRQSLLHDPFSLHVVAKAMILFGFIFSCLYVASATDLLVEELLLVTMTAGLATAILADLGVALLPRFSLLTRRPRVIPGVLETRLFGLLFLLGWVWRSYAFSQGLLYGTLIGTKLELTGASNALGALSSLAGVGAWGVAVFARRPLRAAPLIGMEVLWYLGTGSKGAILYILLPFLMVLFHRGRITIDRRLAGVMTLILVVFMLSFVVVHGYRVAVARQIAERGYADFNFGQAVRDIEVNGEDFAYIGRSLSERLNLAERFLLILARDQEARNDPWLGKSYLNGLVWYVPRALWPDKPSMSLGRWFATEYLGWGEESRSEAGVTLWGEAYLNFKIAGALLVPGLWIVFLQLIYNFCLALGRWGLLFLASGYLTMVNSLAANLAMPVATLSQLGLLLFVIHACIDLLRSAGRRFEVPSHG